MDINLPGEVWLISVLAEYAAGDQWGKICLATANLSINAKIEVPQYGVHSDCPFPNLMENLRYLSSLVSGILKRLVKFSIKIGEKPSHLWENLSVFNGHWNGCITKFCWNTEKYPSTMAISQVLCILHEQFRRTQKHFNDIWKDYDHTQKALATIRQRKERNPENQPEQYPSRRRGRNVGTGTRQMYLLIRYVENTFRETFDLFLHVNILQMYVLSVQNFWLREFVMFLATPLDSPRALTVFDKFFWENHRLLPYTPITQFVRTRVVGVAKVFAYCPAEDPTLRCRRLGLLLKCSGNRTLWEAFFRENGIRCIPDSTKFPSLEDVASHGKTVHRPYSLLVVPFNFLLRP